MAGANRRENSAWTRLHRDDLRCSPVAASPMSPMHPHPRCNTTHAATTSPVLAPRRCTRRRRRCTRRRCTRRRCAHDAGPGRIEKTRPVRERGGGEHDRKPRCPSWMRLHGHGFIEIGPALEKTTVLPRPFTLAAGSCSPREGGVHGGGGVLTTRRRSSGGRGDDHLKKEECTPSPRPATTTEVFC